ncbi:hypothetical protein V1478_009630 [Vespula squamosa]|uniref:Uncharacterized protein n=1 Tax=Vespula squamosa TaxID=30214 RepID=A0ABD2AR32_VESSQ
MLLEQKIEKKVVRKKVEGHEECRARVLRRKKSLKEENNEGHDPIVTEDKDYQRTLKSSEEDRTRSSRV